MYASSDILVLPSPILTIKNIWTRKSVLHTKNIRRWKVCSWTKKYQCQYAYSYSKRMCDPDYCTQYRRDGSPPGKLHGSTLYGWTFWEEWWGWLQQTAHLCEWRNRGRELGLQVQEQWYFLNHKVTANIKLLWPTTPQVHSTCGSQWQCMPSEKDAIYATNAAVCSWPVGTVREGHQCWQGEPAKNNDEQGLVQEVDCHFIRARRQPLRTTTMMMITSSTDM